MTRSCVLVAALLLPSSVWAAATYTYSGSPYQSVANNTTCTVGNCPATYTTAMRVNGSFTTAAPLPPNLPPTSIAPQITSYTFNDGINTIASGDPDARVAVFFVSTDASGALTFATEIILERWTTGSNPHAVSDRLNYMQIQAAGGDSVRNDVGCNAVGLSGAGTPDSCIFVAFPDTNTSGASTDLPGTWTLSAQSIGAPIPTLSWWSSALLSVSLAVFGTLAVWMRRPH